LVLVLAGCELVFPLGPGNDPGFDAAPPRFGTAVKIMAGPVGPTETLADATLDAGMTQLAFARLDPAAPGTADIYLAAASGDPTVWDAPVLFQMSVGMQDEVNPKLSADGLTMWIAIPSATPIVRAFRRVPGEPNLWADVTNVEANGLDHPDPTRPGRVTADGLHMTVHRTDFNGVQYLVELARTQVGLPWNEVPGTTTVINATGHCGNGHLTDDGLELVFTLQPFAGDGDYDLYFARRSALGEPFDTPVEISELSSAMHETDPWLSPDGNQIYFSRAHGGAPLEEWGIYYAER
jgi:hypothetical protein